MMTEAGLIAAEEFDAIKYLARSIGLSEELLATHGAAGLMLSVLADRVGAEEGGDDLQLQALASFELLCRSTPKTPKGAILLLSMAYGAAALALHLLSVEHQYEMGLRNLLLATECKAKFLFIVELPMASLEEVFERERRALLSAAGARGAKAKNAKFESLRAWVDSQLPSVRSDHMTASRRLAQHLPNHLAGVSKNPERMIYDILRELTKPKKTPLS